LAGQRRIMRLGVPKLPALNPNRRLLINRLCRHHPPAAAAIHPAAPRPM